MTTSIEARLASALGRRNEAPNVELAIEIATAQDRRAVETLVVVMTTGTRAAKSDAIKVLYEIGEREPALIVEHTDAFVGQLEGGGNRLVWGALTALACIGQVAPDRVFANLGNILGAADKGSVIAKDRAMDMLAALMADRRYTQSVTPIMLDRLAASAVNQLPMYAERALPAVADDDKPAFRDVLNKRLSGTMPASKKKRIEAVLKRL